MDYTEYWKTVTPHIKQIKIAANEYLKTTIRDVEMGIKDRGDASLELLKFVEHVERSLGGITYPVYDIAQHFFFENVVQSKKSNRVLKFPKKGGDPDASL